jgi:hypothetical protein
MTIVATEGMDMTTHNMESMATKATITLLTMIRGTKGMGIAKTVIKIMTITILMTPKPGTAKTATTAISTVPTVNIRDINITIMENKSMGRMSMIMPATGTIIRVTAAMIIRSISMKKWKKSIRTNMVLTNIVMANMTTEVISMAITDMAGTTTARALCR